MGCDADIRVPARELRWASGEGFYIRRGKGLASLLKLQQDNRSAKESLCVGVQHVWMSVSCSAGKGVTFGGGLQPGPAPSGSFVCGDPLRVDVIIM